MDTELNLAVPPVDVVDVQKFYTPDFSGVLPTGDDEAAKIAFNLDYDGWIVNRGWDGEGDTLQEIPSEANQIPDDKPKESFWKSWRQGFARENTVLNVMDMNARKIAYPPTPQFDPQKRPEYSDPRYEKYREALIFNQSDGEFNANIAQIEKEMERDDYIAGNGVGGVLGMMAGSILSPETFALLLVPEIGAARAGRPLIAAAEFLIYGAAQEGLSEAIKLDSQLTRTDQEALLNIGVAGLISGVVGGGVGMYARAEMAAIERATAEDVSNNIPLTRIPDEGEIHAMDEATLAKMQKAGGAWDDSLSAARVDAPTLDDYSLVPTKIGFIPLKLENIKLNPVMRLVDSASINARKMATWIVDSPYYHKGHEAGKNLSSPIGSVERRALIAEYNAKAVTVNALRNEFAKYRKLDKAGQATFFGEIKGTVQDMMGASAREQKMNWDKFKTEVSRALRSGNQSPYKEVTAAAKTIRDKVYTPYLKQMQEVGLLDEGIDPAGDYALKYINRVWDSAKVRADRRVIRADGEVVGGLEKTLADHYRAIQKSLRDTMAAMVKDVKGRSTTRIGLEKQQEFESRTANLEAEVGGIKAFLGGDFNRNDPRAVKRALGLHYKPQSMVAFIRDAGGLYDNQGELAARGITNKQYAGLITKQKNKGHSGSRGGWFEEDLREYLFDNGYRFYKNEAADVSMDDIWDAIADEAVGDATSRVRRYTDDIELEIKSKERPWTAEDAELVRSMEKAGVNTARPTKEQIEKYIIERDGGTVEKFEAENLALKKGATKALAESQKLEADLEAMAEYINMDEAAIRGLARDTVDNILGTQGGVSVLDFLPDTAVLKASSLRERLLKIDDALIEDYLENDAERLVNIYTNTLSPQIEFTRTFGSLDLKDQMESIKADYKTAIDNKVIEMKAAGKSDDLVSAETARMTHQLDRDLADVKALTDKVMGKYKRPDDPDAFWQRASQFVKRYNLLRMLGGMQIAAIPDIGRPIMVKGMRPFMRTLKAINSSAYKLSKQEAQKAAVGYEALLNSRMKSMADLAEDGGRRNKMERGIDSLAMGFGKATGMSFHNDFWKSFSGVMVQDEIIRAAKKLSEGGKLSAKELRDSAKSGLGTKELDAIANEIRAGHFHDEDGLLVPLYDKWNPETKQAAWSAVSKSIDEIIVTVGKGEMPLWMSHELGSHIMQFKSFLVSSHSKVMLSGLQANDAAMLEGVLISMGLGYGVYSLKAAIAGKQLEDESFGNQVLNAADRSGILGFTMEPIGILPKVTGGVVNVKKLWGGEGDEGLQRYESRNVGGALLGASTDLFGDVLSVNRAAFTGEVSEGDIKAMRKLIPYQNLSYLNYLFTKIQDQAVDEFATN